MATPLPNPGQFSARSRGRLRIDRRAIAHRLRLCAGALVAVTVLTRPVHLESIRWWRSTNLVDLLGLTNSQAETIDRIYDDGLQERRSCVERFAAASDRVDQLLRDGVYDDVTLRQTEQAIKATADEREVTRSLDVQVASLLSAEQRRSLALLRPGPLIE